MFKLNTLKFRVIIYFSIVISISLALLGGISYLTFSAFTEREMINNTSAVADQVNQNLDTYLNEIKNSLQFLSIDQNIISVLQESSTGINYQTEINRVQISQMFYNLFGNKTDIKAYVIYNLDHNFQLINNGKSIDFNSVFLKKVWTDFLNTPYALKTKFYGSHKPDYYANYSSTVDKNVITIAENIKDAYDPSNHKLLGVAIFDYNISKLKNILDNVKSRLNMDSAIVDSNNEAIYESNPLLSLADSFHQHKIELTAGHYNDTTNGSKYLITYGTSSVTGWKIIFSLPISQLKSKLSIIRNTTLLLIVIMIIITILLSTAISIRTTKPFRKLAQYMVEIGNGRLDIRIPRDYQYVEINILNKGFNEMLERINYLIKDVIEKQLLQKEAEYRALQAKVNPHFLYNTLQSINSLAILGRNQDIEKVTHSLRDLLKYSLYQQNDMVKVRQEIDCIENYLRIQNIRYDGRLDYEIHIEDKLLDCTVVKFILQPIIENAIYHALEATDGSWLIKVTGKLDGSNGIIEVTDNGVGMSEQRLQEVIIQLEDNNNNSDSIGLGNIANRIKLKYGPEAKMDIQSKIGVGTSIIFFIPNITGMGRSENDNNHSS